MRSEQPTSLPDSSPSRPDIAPSRRDALAAALSVCACCTAIGLSTTTAAADEASDRVPAPKAGPQDVGPLSDYAADGIYDAHARTKQLFVVRAKNELRAFTSICTHKRCILRKASDAQLRCPCHQAEFTANGVVTKKAPTSLPHYAIALDANGHVIVDTSKPFAEKDWDDAAAVLKV